MKHLVLLLLTFLSIQLNAQNFFRKTYDKWFPNNKHIQIQKLNKQIDSLKIVENTLRLDIEKNKDVVLALEQKNDSLQQEVHKAYASHDIEKLSLKDSVLALNFARVVCKEELMPSKFNPRNPTVKNTCTWRHYVFVETGEADNKGVYRWKTELYERTKDTVQLIKNEDLFIKDSLEVLVQQINQQLKIDFEYLVSTDKKCFRYYKKFEPFKLEQMRLVLLDKGEISFEVNYALLPQCFALSTSAATFKIEDLKKYFR